MTGTRILEVRKVVVDGVAELPEFTTKENGRKPHVSMTWPIGSKAAERFYTEQARFDQEPASLRAGRTNRNEVGTFLAVIRVEGINKSQEDTSRRAVDLGTAFELFIADHRIGLDVEGLNALYMNGPGELQELFNEHGTLALLSYTVAYQARLD